MSEFQNIRTFLLKAIHQTGVKKYLFFEKIQSTVPWTYIISDLSNEKIMGRFYKKELRKTNRK